MRATPRRHTGTKRMRAEFVEIKETLNCMRYPPVPGRWAGQVMSGDFAYYGVQTNARRSPAA